MRVGISLVGLFLLLVLGPVLADQPGTASADKDALQKALEDYAAAMNKRDLAAIGSFWADNAEFIDEAGQVTRGRKAIVDLFQESFKQDKEHAFKIRVRSVRFPRPDLAMQDGIVEVSTKDGDLDRGAYASLWARTDGKWQIVSVRDLPASAVGVADDTRTNVKPLEWLVGDWVYQGKDNTVTLSCRPTLNRKFLQVEQKVEVKGEEVLSLIHLVGWDPVRQRLHSWVFDSTGGFGASVWTRQGNEWTATAEGILADGRSSSATNSWKYVDQNSFEWSSRNREIDGEPSQDLRLTYTRKAAAK